MSVVDFSADSWQASAPGLQAGIGTRAQKLDGLAQGLEALASSSRISGRGADGMRAYIREVHLPIAQCLLLALQTFNTAIGVYWQGYSQVDTDGNFRLVDDEFGAHVSQLGKGMRQLRGFARELRSISASAGHVVSLGGAGAAAVDRTVDEFERMGVVVKTQREAWGSYEGTDHGFAQVLELLGELKTMLGDVGSLTVGQGRDYTPGSFGPSLSRLGALVGPMVEYCQENQKVGSDGWQALFDGYVEDVKAREERERKEEGAWGMVWDGLQMLGGATIAAVGLGLTPFSGGTSLTLTALGGAMVVGGTNNMINHFSMARTGQEFNLVGMAGERVGRWYDAHVARPAADSGNWGLRFFAALGAGVGDLVSGGLQLNVREIGGGVWSLATDQGARSRLWGQVKGVWGQVKSGDPVVIGRIVGNLLPLGAGVSKLSKIGKVESLLGKVGRGGKIANTFTPSAPLLGLEGGKGIERVFPKGRLAKKGEPGSFGYDEFGDLLPYANHRPSYGPELVKQVWDETRARQIRAVEAGADDAPPRLPGPDEVWVRDVEGQWKTVRWRPGESRWHLWDMGHISDAPYADLRERYLSGGITKKQFLEEYRNSENYEVQDWLRNQSHLDEKK